MPRVLLIDDDKRLHELLATYLEQNGFAVVGAPDGQRGLAALDNEPFDVVLLDDVALENATARIDDAGPKVRAAVRTAVAKIHEVLDDRQRKMLADMIDSSWRAGW